MSGAAHALPHLETIQRSFGPDHDLSGVRSHIGGPAADAAAEMGALAYAKGERVAFAAPPSLHTAAHEAAHVVQQRAGVHLKSGVGEVGDRYEQHADAVADAVVRGDSARELLNQFTGRAGEPQGSVQRKPAPAHAAAPAHGHRPTAGPSADDRGPEDVHDFQTRLLQISDVGTGCQIRIGGGAKRGLYAGMEGYVRAGAHLLAEFQIDAVQDAFSTAHLPMPAAALQGCHEVVVNPTSKPGPARDIKGQITEAERGSGGVRLVIDAGAPAGVRAGMNAYMHEHDGAPPYKHFIIDAVHADTCQAFVQLANDDLATSYAHVVINPSGGGAPGPPAHVEAAGHSGRRDSSATAAAPRARPVGRGAG